MIDGTPLARNGGISELSDATRSQLEDGTLTILQPPALVIHTSYCLAVCFFVVASLETFAVGLGVRDINSMVFSGASWVVFALFCFGLYYRLGTVYYGDALYLILWGTTTVVFPGSTNLTLLYRVIGGLYVFLGIVVFGIGRVLLKLRRAHQPEEFEENTRPSSRTVLAEEVKENDNNPDNYDEVAETFRNKVLAFWKMTSSAFVTSKFVSLYILPMLLIVLLVDSSQTGTTYVVIGSFVVQLYMYLVVGLGHIIARGGRDALYEFAEDELEELKLNSAFQKLDQVIGLRRPIFGAFLTAVSTSLLFRIALQQGVSQTDTSSLVIQLSLIGVGLIMEVLIGLSSGLTYHVWVAKIVFSCSECDCAVSQAIESICNGSSCCGNDWMTHPNKAASTVLKIMLEIPELLLYGWASSYMLLFFRSSAVVRESALATVVFVFCFLLNYRLTDGLLIHDENYRLAGSLLVIVGVTVARGFVPGLTVWAGTLSLMIIFTLILTSILPKTRVKGSGFHMETIFHDEISFGCQMVMQSCGCYCCRGCFKFFFAFKKREQTATDFQLKSVNLDCGEIVSVVL